MQVKTIKRVIKNKLNEWLDTITDKQLREDVGANLMVSGGAIASLFLGEQVNDYDIYLQDEIVLKRLCNYYLLSTKYKVKSYSYNDKVEHFKGRADETTYNLEDRFLKVIKKGQIRLHVNSAGLPIERDEPLEGGEYLPVFVSQNAISLSDDVQIVTRFTGTPEEIHKNYDFIHAINYYTMKDGLVTNKESLECLLTKTLKYQGSLYPLTSIIRIKKFIGRGWRINAGEILKIIFQCSELDLRDIEVLEEQLIGVDVAYFSELITILEGTPPSNITSKFLNEIIDRVFNESDIDD